MSICTSTHVLSLPDLLSCLPLTVSFSPREGSSPQDGMLSTRPAAEEGSRRKGSRRKRIPKLPTPIPALVPARLAPASPPSRRAHRPHTHFSCYICSKWPYICHLVASRQTWKLGFVFANGKPKREVRLLAGVTHTAIKWLTQALNLDPTLLLSYTVCQSASPHTPHPPCNFLAQETIKGPLG